MIFLLIALVGDIRTGKTLMSTIFAYDSYNNDRDIWSNYEINLPNYHELKPSDLDNEVLPNNIDAYIDEVYTWLESRSHNRPINKMASYLLFASGKKDVNIFVTLQLFSTMDVRFRDMANVIIETYKYPTVFEYKIYKRIHGIVTYVKTIFLPYDNAKEFFPFFDTLQLIQASNKKDLQYKLYIDDPDRLLPFTLQIVYDICDDLNGDYTHDNIKFTMLQHEYKLQFEKYVYLTIKKIRKENLTIDQVKNQSGKI